MLKTIIFFCFALCVTGVPPYSIDVDNRNDYFEIAQKVRPNLVRRLVSARAENGAKSVYKNILLTVYQRKEEPLILTGDLDLLLPDADRNVVFLVHGDPTSKFSNPQGFFSQVQQALLTEGNYYVVTVNYTKLCKKDTNPVGNPENFQHAYTAGKMIAGKINELRIVKNSTKRAFYIIANQMGNAAVVGAADYLNEPVEYVYGLEQDVNDFNNKSYYKYFITKYMGKLVQTVNVDSGGFNMGDRNFYLEYCNVANGKLPMAYEYLVKSIKKDKSITPGLFCTSSTDIILCKKSKFPEINVWNNAALSESNPEGNYFLFVKDAFDVKCQMTI